jgi:hypothetical protein
MQYVFVVYIPYETLFIEINHTKFNTFRKKLELYVETKFFRLNG